MSEEYVMGATEELALYQDWVADMEAIRGEPMRCWILDEVDDQSHEVKAVSRKDGAPRGASQSMSQADIVITADGRVLKDKQQDQAAMTDQEQAAWEAEQNAILASLPDDEARIAYCQQSIRDIFEAIPSYSLEQLLAMNAEEVRS